MLQKLSAKQRSAAILVAEDELTDEAIAKNSGVARMTLDRWKHLPDFQEAVKDHIEALSRDLSRYAIARRDKRIAAMQKRHDAFEKIADEWAERGMTDRQGNPVPGASTGYQRQQATASKGGMIYEYAADTGLSAELRALEKQAAQEVGQWSEKREITGKDGAPLLDLDKLIRVEYVMPDAD